MVKVIERYKFAGDEVIKERLLPADHPDAIAYLKRVGPSSHLDKTKQDAAVDTSSSETAQLDQTSSLSSSASPATSSAPASAPAPAPAPRPPPPGPRRKKQSKLASLAASSDAPKKMNTLEKSKMDWEGWKKGGASAAPAGASGSGGGGGGDAKGLDGLTDREREEMEQQTKTGSGSGSMAGYLGRSDFLERVKERTEGQ